MLVVLFFLVSSIVPPTTYLPIFINEPAVVVSSPTPIDIGEPHTDPDPDNYTRPEDYPEILDFGLTEQSMIWVEMSNGVTFAECANLVVECSRPYGGIGPPWGTWAVIISAVYWTDDGYLNFDLALSNQTRRHCIYGPDCSEATQDGIMYPHIKWYTVINAQ